jgi:hydroxymethylbilane synthase
MLPAVGQGAVGVTCRTGDEGAFAWLAPLDDAETAACVAAERGFLEVLDGSCRTPIAALARCDGDATLEFRGLVAREDGSRVLTVARGGDPESAVELGREAGRELRERAGSGFIEAWE